MGHSQMQEGMPILQQAVGIFHRPQVFQPAGVGHNPFSEILQQTVGVLEWQRLPNRTGTISSCSRD